MHAVKLCCAVARCQSGVFFSFLCPFSFSSVRIFSKFDEDYRYPK